ncbi:monocopper oxidase protein SKU5 [Spatholobus suberectus]|nr:monocopper oxidase protein SKU5 [Spatholobus suberectus]
MLLSWLLFCLFLRFTKLGDGRNVWFNIRWWISRLDICFATRHWLDDQKVVTKRKTELGGAFSIASWILFIGLFAALLYQIISKRSIEVHNVRATNGPELASFVNDMEFNITTVSSMSCANLRNLGDLVAGNPGFIDQRVVSLLTLANHSCYNSSMGPTIVLKCKNCKLIYDHMFISWQFVDLPNNPATAVGFEFKLTSMDIAKKHVSFVSGTLKNGSAFDDSPVTFRGKQSNILKFNLFPRVYHNLHNLKLIQPLFHEFLPGSVSRDTNELQASLESSTDGLVNTTLYINFLSDYVVEIDRENIFGPVSFLADLGGLYCISIGIFFYLLIQCEYRIKKLRNEDSIMRRIRNRRKAQEHWDKLRKYVMYTYGCPTMDDTYNSTKNETDCGGFMLHSVRGTGSSHKRRLKSRKDSINLYKKPSLPANKSVSCKPLGSTNDSKLHSENMAKQQNIGSCKDSPQSHPQESSIIDDNFIPPPPSLEMKGGSEMDMSDIQKNLKNLYEYNVMLRNKLLAAQSLLHSSSSRHSSSVNSSSVKTKET